MFPLPNWAANQLGQAKPSTTAYTRPRPPSRRPADLRPFPRCHRWVDPASHPPSSVSFFRVHHGQRAPIPNLSRFDSFVTPRASPTPYKYFPPPPRPIFAKTSIYRALGSPPDLAGVRKTSPSSAALPRLHPPLPITSATTIMPAFPRRTSPCSHTRRRTTGATASSPSSMTEATSLEPRYA